MSMTEKLAYIKKLRHLTTEEKSSRRACGQDHSGPAHSHTLPFR